MRTVNRGLVPCPTPLDPTQIAADVTAYRACSSTSGVKQRIYGHKDVVNALQNVFFRKCSLCEADATTSGEVEHFVPHCPDRAELAYEWTNLHWTCRACNQRKRREMFKEFRTGTRIVERTMLIDPSAPHGGSVETMLTFDDNLNAQPTTGFQGDRVVQLTAEILNESQPKMDRLTTYKALILFVMESGYLEEWRALIAMHPLDPDARPDPVRAKSALDRADRVYQLYLEERRPFSASIRCLAASELRLPFGSSCAWGVFTEQFLGCRRCTDASPLFPPTAAQRLADS